MSVRPQPSSTAQSPLWLRALGVLLALHILSALVLEASPGLHRKIHPDADSPDHECLATMMGAGLIEPTALGLLFAVLVLAVFYKDLPHAESFLPTVAYRLLPGRAPPLRFA